MLRMVFHNINTRIAFLVSSIFLLCLTYLVSSENYILLFFPFVVAVFYLAIWHIRYLFYAVVFFTPLSMSLKDLGVDVNGFDLAFPTEPILLGFMILIILNLIYRFHLFKEIIKQPVVTILIFYLLWMFSLVLHQLCLLHLLKCF